MKNVHNTVRTDSAAIKNSSDAERSANDENSETEFAKRTAKTAARIAASAFGIYAGAAIGAYAGAAFGTAICSGIGTAAGAVIGGLGSGFGLYSLFD
ncbi:hypothetical protein [Succinimonas sp.]|uniref:hypothetical protein n=1 Tax=Succinimonas sp. TaxID=1936151 RepID=UPI00386D83D5